VDVLFPVFQLYVAAPPAVKIAVLPAQIVCVDAVMDKPLRAPPIFTLTVWVLLHPALVPITE
jgi:hypothetical protein